MKTKNLLFALLVSCAISFVFTACEEDVIYDSKNMDNPGEPKQINIYKVPKYIFYFIGDGMATPQINVTEAAVFSPEFKLKSAGTVGVGKLNMQDFPVTGMQMTHAEDRYITGSAASATALACGYKTTIGTIGQSGDGSMVYKTMAEMAKEKGMKVGIVSSVSIDHATPACFYAHTNSRNNYFTIGQHLTQSNFDYFAGGGVRWNKYSKEGQPKDISVFLDAAAENGYKYVNTRNAFEALDVNSGKVIATLEKFATNTSDGCALPYTIDLDEFGPNDNITLSEFTAKGIEVLNNENGFFMMVEGGKIDWACHANDVVSAAHNTVEFDKAIGLALDFYEDHKEETLIIITGDHECGGLTLGFSATGYSTVFTMLNHQSVSYVSFSNKVRSWATSGNVTFEMALDAAKADFGLGDETLGLGLSTYEIGLLEDAFDRSMTGESAHDDQEISIIYGYYDPFTVTVTHILNNKAGIDWTSYSHTGIPVPVFAKGQGEHAFNGYYDNTDIAKKIIGIGQLDPTVDYENENPKDWRGSDF